MKYSEPQFIFALRNIRPISISQANNSIICVLEDKVKIIHNTEDDGSHIYVKFIHDYPDKFEIENHSDLKEIALIHLKGKDNFDELYDYCKNHFTIIDRK